MNFYKLVNGELTHVTAPHAELGPLIPGDDGWQAPPPVVNELTHKVFIKLAHDKEANVVREQWTVEPLSENELAQVKARAWHSVRMRRDGLLAATDWRMLPDAPGENREAWVAYRKALREITEQEVDPRYVVWPVMPSN